MTEPLDDFLMELSTELLGVGPDDVALTINAALGRLCPILGADRGYVLKTRVRTSSVEVFEQWWAPGIEQRVTPILELPIEAQRFWAASLREGQAVCADDVDTLADQCPEAAAALRADGVRSLLFMPLMAKGASVGFVGFETRRGTAAWAADTVARIRTVGELLVGAIDRCQADAQREAAAAALADRNAELERSNRELQQFASIVSHDLKQPLAVAQGFLQVLSTIAQDHPTRGEDAARYAVAASRGIERMSALIDEVYALARSGSPAGPPEPVQLKPLVGDVLTDLEASIADAKATITVGDLPVVEGNQSQLRQLVQNLVANALKFRRPGVEPRVAITAADRGGRCLITVADNGVGIAPDQREAVFEMFARGTGAAPGLGIGLAVCTRVVANHGGRIWIEDNEGGGSVFNVELPYRQG